MNRLDMAIALVREAQFEQSRLEEMEDRIGAVSSRDPKWIKKREAIRASYSVMPDRRAVNDCLKMAVRLIKHEMY